MNALESPRARIHPRPPRRFTHPSRSFGGVPGLGPGLVVAVGLCVLASSLGANLPTGLVAPQSSSASTTAINEDSGWAELPHPMLAPSESATIGPLQAANLDIAIALASQDPTGLESFLRNVSTPGSPAYDHFLTLKEFEDRFGATAAEIGEVKGYLQNRSIRVTTVYPGGLVLDAAGSPSSVGLAFHTSLRVFRTAAGSPFFAPASPPAVPTDLLGTVLGVSGLTNSTKPVANWGWGQNAYQQGTAEQLFGPDLQVPNDLPGVYNSTVPRVLGTGETIATILWDGQGCTSGIPVYTGCSTWGTETAAFNPVWITQYLDTYLPSWEPRPNIAGVPVDGAIAPGPSADLDATGSIAESALDLEVAGSLAPGANITEVYTTCNPTASGPAGATLANVDDAFATAVTNPNGSPALDNVTVISNSWGIGRTAGQVPVSDAAWTNMLMEANALGITVLASSGDAGNDSLSWPAVIGNDSFGMIAVGGTTLNVSGAPATQHFHTVSYAGQPFPGIYSLPQSNAGSTVTGIAHQSAWAGTSGGASLYYTEPAWQKFALQGNAEDPAPMRGVPDIAGVANDTLVELNVTGATGGLASTTVLAAAAGTSVASPADAAILAIVAGAVGHRLGFLDPTLYSLGYNQTLGRLPAPAFHDVTHGRNANYTARAGWDAVTGWGTLNASGLVEDLSLYPLVTSFAASPDAVPVGGTTYLNATVIFGKAPYTYSYSGLPLGCSNVNASKLVCVPTSSGTYSVLLNVSDAAGFNTSAVTMLTTGLPDLSAFSAIPPSIVLGETSELTVNSTAGTLFDYTGLPAGCSTQNVSELPCTPTRAGSFTVEVFVNNSYGSSSRTTSLTVVVQSITGLSATPEVATVPVDSALVVLAEPRCTGGACSASMHYAWVEAGGLGTLNSTTGPSIRFEAGDRGGATLLSVSASLNGSYAMVSVAITVTASISSVVVSASASNAVTGQVVNFSATVTCLGGPCPSGTTYSWSLANGSTAIPSATGSDLTLRAGPAPGHETVTVNATLDGISVEGTTTIVVTAPPTPSPASTGLEEGAALAAGGASIIAVAAVLLGRRRQRSNRD
jgi:Pro-kumamolisin, activation domain